MSALEHELPKPPLTTALFWCPECGHTSTHNDPCAGANVYRARVRDRDWRDLERLIRLNAHEPTERVYVEYKLLG